MAPKPAPATILLTMVSGATFKLLDSPERRMELTRMQRQSWVLSDDRLTAIHWTHIESILYPTALP